ncbi:MAG: DUF4406 domain-containing protein [Tannerella sp.]|jgi:hypothetical protein|nr:DUF4406 domain-containing protein [Tannerella sp.]
MKKIYISGKISGLPIDEVEAKFEEAEAKLKAEGYEVVCPLKNEINEDVRWETYMKMDIIMLMGCDAIYMLSDWENSRGASLEKQIAECTGKDVIYQIVPKFQELKQAISEVFEMSFYDITGNSRKRENVCARMIFAHYCSLIYGTTGKEIADEIKRDNCTVSYYLKNFNDYNRFDVEFKAFVREVERTLSTNGTNGTNGTNEGLDCFAGSQ